MPSHASFLFNRDANVVRAWFTSALSTSARRVLGPPWVSTTSSARDMTDGRNPPERDMNTRSEKVDDYIAALTDGLADLTEVSDRAPWGTSR